MSLLGCTRHELYLGTRSRLDSALEPRLRGIMRRRRAGMPLAYALGTTYFHSAEIRVHPDVLIPRPDSETLVETILEHEPHDTRWLLDMGTGSGALTAILLRCRPAWRAIATDISFGALRVAADNAAGLPASLVCADRLEAVRCDRALDFVVSNPPYVTHAELATLDSDVRDYEPHIALDGGVDGLDFYRHLAVEAPRVLHDGGRLYLEIGATQAGHVVGLLARRGWREVSVRRDLGRRPRAVRAVCPHRAQRATPLSSSSSRSRNEQ